MAATREAQTLKKLKQTFSDSSQQGRLIVRGLTDVVKRMRNRYEKLKALQEQHRDDERRVADVVDERRLEEERAGNFYKTVEIAAGRDHDGNELPPARMVYKNAFSAVTNHEQREVLTEAFGSEYRRYFVEHVSIKVNDGVSLAMLRTMLGPEGFGALEQLAEISTAVRGRGNVMEARAQLRRDGETAIVKKLDIVFGNIQHKPQFVLGA